MPAHYDDRSFSYDRYWQGRQYEHQSELLAISRLLADSRFSVAADIGGGYGRLTAFLTPFSKQILLIEPSVKQRRMGQNYLKGLRGITISGGTIQKTGLPDASLDLVLVVRVMHHLPDPAPALSEIYRVLKPGGTLILEFANSLNFKARLRSQLTGQPILPAPLDRRSSANIRRHTIPFVNHYPSTLLKLLSKTGFQIDRVLSVSNFRSPLLKRLLPQKFLLSLEKYLQPRLGKIYFGPSIFIKATKIDKYPNL